MKRYHQGLFAAAVLLAGLGGSAAAQRGNRPDAVVDRVNSTVARMQDRIGNAQDRAGTVQDRLNRIPDRASRVGERGLGRAAQALSSVPASARKLAKAQTRRVRDLVRVYSRQLEMTDIGPAVRAQIIAVDPDVASLAAARAAGYEPIAEDLIEGLGIRSVTLRPPAGVSVQAALQELARIAPGASFAANHLHLQSGAALPAARAAPALAGSGPVRAPVAGMIDGGIAQHPSLGSAIEQRSFVKGPPRANGHATAAASLLVGRGSVRGVRPGGALLVADIYGSDPAGGNALSLAKALGWMAARRVPVVAVSIVGPRNALVAKAVAQAQAKGMRIVAPVGNDGPASPPVFPASYPGVIAVTGVDGRQRPLIEAGRALHLDYAAPAADIVAANAAGGLSRLRGTSFAVPFVAGRLSALIGASPAPLARLDAEALDLGEPGPDRLFGRGLVCGGCGTLAKK